MTTFLFVAIVVMMVIYLLLTTASQKSTNKIRAEKEEVFEEINHEFAISGQGLFYAFYPSPMSLQCAELTGMSSLVLEDPRLKEFQIRYGPVDQVDADNFAEEARYCQSSSETVIPIGSVTAFAGRVSTPPPLENGFWR